TELLNQHVTKPLTQSSDPEAQSLMDWLEGNITISKMHKVQSVADCVKSIGIGNPLLLCEGENIGLSLGLTKFETRGIQEPGAEAVLRGSREGFTESLQINLSQLRRIIK